MAPKAMVQFVEPGNVTLRTGTELPMSTYTEVISRLMKEAEEAMDASGRRLANDWIIRRIKRDIKTCYGRVCAECMQPITMHWDGQPHRGELFQPNEAGETSGWFHTVCWTEYKKEKARKRRRRNHAARMVDNLQGPHLCICPPPAPAPPPPAAVPAAD